MTPAARQRIHDLELVYGSNETLALAIWSHWDRASGNPPVPDAVTDAWEFRYDSGRQRYLAQQWDPSQDPGDPENWIPVGLPVYTDYLGEQPYSEYEVEENAGEVTRTEQQRYLAAMGLHAVQLMAEPDQPVRYLHGDLVRSTMLTVDGAGQLVRTAAYTAFGEPVTWDDGQQDWRVGVFCIATFVPAGSGAIYTVEHVWRQSAGRDGEIPIIIKTKLDGITVSIRHVVVKAGQITHDHIRFVGSSGDQQPFPPEWGG